MVLLILVVWTRLRDRAVRCCAEFAKHLETLSGTLKSPQRAARHVNMQMLHTGAISSSVLVAVVLEALSMTLTLTLTLTLTPTPTVAVT